MVHTDQERRTEGVGTTGAAVQNEETMGIGTGIALLLVGLILLLGVVEVDLPWVDDYALGLLLTIMGVVALVLVFAMNATRRRSTHIIERDRDAL